MHIHKHTHILLYWGGEKAAYTIFVLGPTESRDVVDWCWARELHIMLLREGHVSLLHLMNGRDVYHSIL